MEKILITGATGYLGACINALLAENTSFKVDTLKVRLEDIQPNSLAYDYVIHCAGALRYKTGEHTKSNAEGTVALLKGLKTATKIMYLSSKSIYGTKRLDTVNELTIPEPDDDYGLTKYEGEKAIVESGHPFLIFRLSTVFGLGRDNIGPAFPSIATKKLFQQEDVTLFKPDVYQEYIYVKDVARAIILALTKASSWHEIYNLSGEKKSLFALLSSIQNVLRHNKHQSGEIKLSNTTSKPTFFLDSSKFINAFNFEFTPYEAIIHEMYLYLTKTLV